MSVRRTTGGRTIAVMAVVATVSLAAGLGLSRLIVSPAEAAADAAPPAAGPITVPVESRVIANGVTIRGDARYDDPAQVRVEAGDLGGPAVVTGHVPEIGTTLEAASVALEVAGRPVIVLTGALPTYRTLSSGVSGPDVLQLKAALAALGIGAGDAASDRYDAATADGVVALYRRVGYEPPAASAALKASVDAARVALTQSQDALATAKRELAKTASGPPRSTLAELDASVSTAQQQLAELVAQCAPRPEPATPADAPTCVQSQVVAAQGALDVARLRRAEASAAPDTSAEKAVVDAATRQVADATKALAEAKTQTLTTLPASEIVFLPSLPRRVDAVSVTRGATVNGPVMSVSGATLEIVATAQASDAALLSVGAVGSITVEGTAVPVTVTAVTKGTGSAATNSGATNGGATNGAGAGGAPGGAGTTDGAATDSGRYTVRLLPGTLTDAQLTALQGSNVRVVIPVSSTGGAVLAVPLAALTAGPGGESRIERAKADGTTSLVTVKTGLAAGGYVEIQTSEVPLAVGDLVVVGTGGSSSGAKAGATASPSSSASAAAKG